MHWWCHEPFLYRIELLGDPSEYTVLHPNHNTQLLQINTDKVQPLHINLTENKTGRQIYRAEYIPVELLPLLVKGLHLSSDV
jgi:hypothetical protein